MTIIVSNNDLLTNLAINGLKNTDLLTNLDENGLKNCCRLSFYSTPIYTAYKTIFLLGDPLNRHALKKIHHFTLCISYRLVVLPFKQSTNTVGSPVVWTTDKDHDMSSLGVPFKPPCLKMNFATSLRAFLTT